MKKDYNNYRKEKQRFSIIKVSGKTTSVLVGLTIFGGLLLDAPNAKADTTNNDYTVSIDASAVSTVDKSKEVALSSTSNEAKDTTSANETTSSSQSGNTTNAVNTQATSTTTDTNKQNNVEANNTTANTTASNTSADSNVATTNEVVNASNVETPTNKRVRRSVLATTNSTTLNSNGQDRDSGTVVTPKKVSPDGVSMIQIGGEKPAVPSGGYLVTMNVTFKSRQGSIHVSNLPLQINGVDTTKAGNIYFITGISNIDLDTTGVNYTIYLVTKNTTSGADYVLTNDNIVLPGATAADTAQPDLPNNDEGYVSLVTSVNTTKTSNNLVKNIVIEVADAPILTDAAKAGIVVRKKDTLKVGDYVTNAGQIPLVTWGKAPNTSNVGNQKATIQGTYNGGLTSWTYGGTTKVQSQEFNVEVTDADALFTTFRGSQSTKYSNNYKYASADKRAAFDTAQKNAATAYAQHSTSQADIDAAKVALEKAIADLDGDQNIANIDGFKTSAKDAIDKLENLNNAQKVAAKQAVDSATTPDGVTAAQNTATSLDGKMSDLSNSVADVDATKASENYTDASEAAKKAYDDAVAAAQAITDKASGTNADGQRSGSSKESRRSS